MYCPLAAGGIHARLSGHLFIRGSAAGIDEYGDRHFTFSVYFRPEELGPAEQEVLLRRKGGRAEAAELFELTTSREPEARRVIDEGNSHSAKDPTRDGLWVQDES